ncbi:MAG: 30S ribosomal protein S20 [Chloroflexi bacterium]|nr:30S ribosomal protein S20 [Chloroflexota bacterium]
MPNIKSAEKRARQSEKRRVQNRVYRAAARTAVKKARIAIDTTNPESEQAVLNAIQALDKAAAKGTIHANNAARRKSRLMAQLHKMSVAE